MFVASGALNKAIISYHVGKRTVDNAEIFLRDLRERVPGRPQISSDAWPGYEPAFRKLRLRSVREVIQWRAAGKRRAPATRRAGS